MYEDGSMKNATAVQVPSIWIHSLAAWLKVFSATAVIYQPAADEQVQSVNHSA